MRNDEPDKTLRSGRPLRRWLAALGALGVASVAAFFSWHRYRLTDDEILDRQAVRRIGEVSLTSGAKRVPIVDASEQAKARRGAFLRTKMRERLAQDPSLRSGVERDLMAREPITMTITQERPDDMTLEARYLVIPRSDCHPEGVAGKTEVAALAPLASCLPYLDLKTILDAKKPITITIAPHDAIADSTSWRLTVDEEIERLVREDIVRTYRNQALGRVLFAIGIGRVP